MRQPEDAQAGQPGRQVGVAVVHRQHMTARHPQAFLAPAHGVGQGLAGARPEEADDTLVAVLQFARVARHAGALQVGRCRVDPQLQVADPPRHQRLVAQFAAADDAIDVLVDQVDEPIAHAQVDLDLRIARMELGQRRDQQQPRQRARYVDPETPAGRQGGAGEAGLGIVQFRQQAYHPLVVGGAVGGQVELARGAVEQAYSQPRFQLLDQLGDAGAAHVQRLRRLGEAAGIHHTGKGLHRIETVHRDSGSSGIVWILQTVMARVARLSTARTTLPFFHRR